jgi:site-specific DNA recombinase
MILGSQAKLENDHKGVNVKRGLRAKCEQGWRPGPAPLGYIHDKYADKGDKKVFIDPKRAPYIKKIFEKVAYEGWSGRKIYRWLIEETSFRTKNNKYLTLSMIYRILDDTYYYGEFEYPLKSDSWYQGKHDPIISKTLFQKTRERLKRDNIERHECKEFAFTKLIKCGHCGSGITADEKFRKKEDGSVRRYVYYGCTRARNIHCKGGYLREEELISQFIKLIDKLDLDELGIQGQLKEEIERYYKFSKSFLNVNPDDFEKQKKTDLKNYAKYILKEGSVIEKRELLKNLRSKLVIKNKKISLINL